MQKRLLVALLCLYLMIVTGCVSIPHEQLSQTIEIQELSDHVHFLAQPALKGRKPRTWESATARRYLKDRFQTYGLLPWAQAKGYEQSSGFGTNVIGVLPGSDPNFANEIVIVSAHYDHLGKDNKGMYHGAGDNASGVAALLEIAERLALSQSRPRRPICFASFDCEEMFTLGSFSFTCRDDFNKSKIAAVVNIDLLGRDFLGVIDTSLFVVGTELYPKLRKQVLKAATENKVKILPIGTDLVGPRGDHVAFETMGMPVLFFTCGLYKDYHKPTDTADKLNYSKMQNSAALIAETVDLLADAEQIDRPVQKVYGDKEELQTVMYLLETINSKYEKAGLTTEQALKLSELAEEAQLLLDKGQYTAQKQRQFVEKTIKAFLPALAMVDDTFTQQGETLLWVNKFYAQHRRLLTEEFRNLARHITENKPGLFGKVKFKYEAYDLTDDELSFAERNDGRYELHALLTKVNINFEMGGWIFKHGCLGFGFAQQPRSCLGSMEDIADFCLLQWQTELEDESYTRIWKRILESVTEQSQGESYEAWLKWRLQQEGWANDKQWVLDLMRSGNQDVAAIAARNAWKITGKNAEKTLCEIITNKNVRADVRSDAIWALGRDTGRKGLLALVNVLGEQTPCWNREYMYFLDKSYPFYEEDLQQRWEKWYEEKGKFITIASEAGKKLQELTKKDFGKDTKAWQKWIDANVK